LASKIGVDTDFDPSLYLAMKDQVDILKKQIVACSNNSNNLLQKMDKARDSARLLETIPCGDSFPECRFLLNAINAKKLLPVQQDELEYLQKQHKEIEDEIAPLQEKLTTLEAQYKLYKQHSDTSKLLQKKNAELEALGSDDLTERIEKITYSEAEILFLKRRQEELLESRKEADAQVYKIHTKIVENNKEIDIYSKLIKKLEEKENFERNIRSKLELLNEYYALVGKNGIITHILGQFVPAISKMMNAIISNLANFGIEIDIEDDKNLEIYLIDEVSKRLIETASGSQKTIVAYALRLALMNYSQLASCNLFILDEPGTSLDKDHLIQFTKLLDMIKSIEKTIILVTHIDMLKDCVDVQFTVEKSSGYSKILS
jgi:DNA repair exonuclease SbcCD ATPase subunit